jgi:hypothetical protein
VRGHEGEDSRGKSCAGCGRSDKRGGE